jgi:predicted amino acid dehydrogenase
MKRIISISLGSSQRDYQLAATVLGQHIDVRRIGTNGDVARATALVREYDGKADAIGLGGLTPVFRVGAARYPHREALSIAAGARRTPVVDGEVLKATIERWAVQKTAGMIRGIFDYRRILIASGIERYQLAEALAQFEGELRFADPIVHLGLSFLPPPRSLRQLEIYAATTLPFLALLPYRYLHPVALGQEGHSSRAEALFHWADVIAGDFAYIRRFAPHDLRGKVLVTDDPSLDEIDDLAARGVSTLVTMTPPLSDERPFVATDVLEAIVVAVQETGGQPSEAEALDFIDATGWGPTVEHLNPRKTRPKFAFLTYAPPIRQSQGMARYLPQWMADRTIARPPAVSLSRLRGIRSRASGEEVEGLLLALDTMPGRLLKRPPAFTHRRLLQAARVAERMGARLMGLGAFASAVHDSGFAVAQRSTIGITSGSSLAVAAAIEAARRGMLLMRGEHGGMVRAVVVGANGAIGIVCARQLAGDAGEIVLIGPHPERLLTLKQTIERETPGARVIAATRLDTYLSSADLIIVAARVRSEGAFDVEKLKPGAVICDIAIPASLTEADAARRPDVLLIDGGVLKLPGDPNLDLGAGLLAGAANASLAEAALLAMDGKFGDYSVGRGVEIRRVREIERLMEKHGLELAGLRSFGRAVADADIAEKRRLAAERRERLGRLEEQEQSVKRKT